jgi:L-ribulose-5-phosphate 4-epimerase
MSSLDELRERAFEANRAIVQAGLVVLTFGNVSAVDRERGVLAIKPSGVPYDELSPREMVVVDLDSWLVVDGDRRPSSDTPTHLVLYREFSDIGGIVHTHSPSATSWAQAGRDLPCFGTTHADHFHGPVPTTRALEQNEIEDSYEERTGDVIVETFVGRGIDPLETPAALVLSHGPFAWGTNLEGAVENAVALEVVASLAFQTLALQPSAASLDGHLLERHFSRKHGPGAYYGQIT